MSNFSRRDLIRVGAVAGGGFSLANFLSACVTPPTASTGPVTTAPKLADKLSIGILQFAASADPQLLLGGQWTEAIDCVFDTLVVMRNDKLAPWIATSWSTRDNITWEFKLRPGVKFSNGEDLDASAVVGTFVRGAKGQTPMTGFARIAPFVDTMEAVDPLTLRVVCKSADGLLPGRLLDMRLIPPKYVQQVGNESFSQKPVGSGPFKVAAFRQNDTFEVEAWEGSWRGVPKLKTIVWRMIPDGAARAAAIRSGEVDIVSDLSVDAAKANRTNPDFKIVATDEGAAVSVFMVPLQDTPFKELKVRQAVRHAINKKVITDNLFAGYYKPLGASFILPQVVGYDASLRDREFNVDRAKALMAEAGFPNGFETKMSANAGIAFVSDSLQVIADQLRVLNIRAEIEVLEASIYNTRFFANQLGPFQVIFSSMTPALDADLTLPFWTSASVPSRMRNEEFDRTLIQSRAETDVAKRTQLLQRATNILDEVSPVAPLYQVATIWGISNKVQNFVKNVAPGISPEGLSKLA